MKTNQILKTALLILLLSYTLPAVSASFTTSTIIRTETPASTDPKVEQLLNRLNELKSKDKTELSHAEKKEMRKEVKVIKKQLKNLNQGVYLSVGAIIIIILLLILIL